MAKTLWHDRMGHKWLVKERWEMSVLRLNVVIQMANDVCACIFCKKFLSARKRSNPYNNIYFEKHNTKLLYGWAHKSRQDKMFCFISCICQHWWLDECECVGLDSCALPISLASRPPIFFVNNHRMIRGAVFVHFFVVARSLFVLYGRFTNVDSTVVIVIVVDDVVKIYSPLSLSLSPCMPFSSN